MTDTSDQPARSDPSVPFRIIGFDLDGTLLETAPDIAAALNHALKIAGLPQLALNEVRPLIGGGAKRLLARALADGGMGTGADGKRVEDDVLDPLYRELLDHYGANVAVDSYAYDGMEAALDALAQQDIVLGVATNKLEGLARDLLGQMGLADRFACIVGGDTLGTERAKPAPDMIHHLIDLCGGGAAAFVGDSIYDVGAAHAANIPCVAVSFGYPNMPVADLGADAVIDHYRGLLPALAQLDGKT